MGCGTDGGFSANFQAKKEVLGYQPRIWLDECHGDFPAMFDQRALLSVLPYLSAEMRRGS